MVLYMSKHEENVKRFIKVRDALNNSENMAAFRLCWKKPYKFYGDHSTAEAIKILKAEANA